MRMTGGVRPHDRRGRRAHRPARSAARSSATFRTADISGLDVLLHVAKELSAGDRRGLRAARRGCEKLAASGQLGEKSGAGFYKKVGKEITHARLEDAGVRAAAEGRRSRTLGALQKQPLDAAAADARQKLPGKYGDFVRNYLLRMSHYVLTTTPSIAYDIVSVDRAMEWGYAWEAGPFKQMDVLGHDFLREGFARLGLDVPPLLREGEGRRVLSRATRTAGRTSPSTATYAPVPPVPGQISLDVVRRAPARVVESSNGRDAARPRRRRAAARVPQQDEHAGRGRADDAAHGARARGARQATRARDRQRRSAHVHAPAPTCRWCVAQVQAGDWKELDADGARLPGRRRRSLRRAPFPVVAAPFGLTLGGGCEFSLHCDRVQAHAELYMGLVEVGVGLIPGGRRNEGAAVPLHAGARAVRRGRSVRGGEARVQADRHGDDEHERARGAQASASCADATASR